MKYAGLYIIFILALVSCSSTGDKQLEFALEFAGENRIELEKVLDYYKGKPDRLNAAEFLIKNMPRCFSYEGWVLDTLRATRKRALEREYLNDEDRNKVNSLPYHTLEKVYDAHVITSEYLINHIDHVFSVWESRPWSTHYTFDDFCEFVLPYRVEHESLEPWREKYYERFSGFLDENFSGTDVIEACALLGEYLAIVEYMLNKDYINYSSGALFLLDNWIGECKDICLFTIYAMRSLGIPIALDFYMYSPDFSNSHHWNAVKDTTGRIVPFWLNEQRAKRGQTDGRKKGKVYRYCYGIQPERYDNLYGNNTIELLFRNPFLKDVTADYFEPNKLLIEADPAFNGSFAYLSVFSIQGWIPIDIAPVRNGKASFSNVEPDLIYQILYPTENQTIANGYALLFDGNDYTYFIPDTTQKEKIQLTRKYTRRNFLPDMVGDKVEGALMSNYSDAQLLYEITERSLFNHYCWETPQSNRRQRYIRYTSDELHCIEFAELIFYSDTAGKNIIPYKVIRSPEPHREDPFFSFDNINDNDPLTFGLSKDSSSVLLLDLQKEVEIKKILYIPRNDDNFIRIGDTYELFFQNGAEGWASLGKRVANDLVLQYDNVPKYSLLWLRNYTRGKEEQIFRYENGEQLFPSFPTK